MGSDGLDRVLPIGLLRPSVGDVFAPVAAESARVPANQIYEGALRLSLQDVVEPISGEQESGRSQGLQDLLAGTAETASFDRVH
jgi:hypothetical protein